MSDNLKLFRNSVNGFNKSDVTSYIEKMNFDFRKEINRLNAELEEKQAESAAVKASTDECDLLQKENEELKASLQSLSEECSALKEKLSESEELINAQNDALDKLCCENESLKEASAACPSVLPDNESIEKAKMYDSMSAKIGQILIDANKNADDILSNARQEADRIIARANKSADGIIDSANKRAEAIYNEAVRKADLFKEDYVSAFEYHSDEILAMVEKLQNTVAVCKDSLALKSKSIYTTATQENESEKENNE